LNFSVHHETQRHKHLMLLSKVSGDLTRSAVRILDEIFVPTSDMLLVPSVVFVFIRCTLEYSTAFN